MIFSQAKSLWLLLGGMLLWLCGCQTVPYAVDSALQTNPRDPGIVSGSLENGFRYFLRSTNGAERDDQIEVRLIVTGGSLNERPGEEGYTHLLEHVVLRGTESFPVTRINALVEKNGLVWGQDVNATTHYNATVFRFSINENERHLLTQILSLYADILDSALIENKVLEAEKKIVEAEWLYRFGQKSFLIDPVAAVAFKNSAFEHRPPAGRPGGIREATPQRLKRYWRRTYHPANAAVVVTGSIVPWELESLIINRFKHIENNTENPVAPLQAVTNHTSFKPKFMAYTDRDNITDQVSINLISHSSNATAPGWMARRYVRALFFKSVSRMMETYLPATDCGVPEFSVSLLDNGESVYRIASTVGNGNFSSCISTLVAAFQLARRQRLSVLEFQLLQGRFRQLAIDEGNRYRAGDAADVADRITKSLTLGTTVLPASLYESQLLEAIELFDLTQFTAAQQEIEKNYQVVYSAVGVSSTKSLPSPEIMQATVEQAANKPYDVEIVRRHPALSAQEIHGSQTLLRQSGQTLLVNNTYQKQWQLANGTRVVLINDERYDYVAVAMAVAGGYGGVSDNLFHAARLLPTAIEKNILRVQSTGKGTDSYLPESTVFVNPTNHGVLAYGSATELPRLFGRLADHFNPASLSSRGAGRLRAHLGPGDVADTYWAGNARPARSISDDQVIRAYQRLFRSPADFTVVVVGNVGLQAVETELDQLNFLVPGAEVSPLLAGLQPVAIPVRYEPDSLGERTAVLWTHRCRTSERYQSDEYLRLLSHVLQHRLRYALRERNGLSYEPGVSLLSDTIDSGERLYNLRYTINAKHMQKASSIVKVLLDKFGETGIARHEFDLAIAREQRRLRELQHDYLAYAVELAMSSLLNQSIPDATGITFDLNTANQHAKCFSSQNATMMVQGVAADSRRTVSSRP